MADLREGDLITLSYSHNFADSAGTKQERVIESRPSDDGDMSWYIKTDGDFFTCFGDPWQQYTLLLDL